MGIVECSLSSACIEVNNVLSLALEHFRHCLGQDLEVNTHQCRRHTDERRVLHQFVRVVVGKLTNRNGHQRYTFRRVTGLEFVTVVDGSSPWAKYLQMAVEGVLI